MTADEQRLQLLRHARIRRVKQFLKWMPRRANIDRYPVLKWFAKATRKRPYLWSFKVSSCTPAFYVGSVIAFLPLMGVQVLLALVAAIFTRANLPIMVGLQAVSNPLTISFLYPLYYLVGRSVMRMAGLGDEFNYVVATMNATFLGGALVGLVVGAVLDLIYRFMVFEASRHSRRRQPRTDGRQAPTGLPLPEPARQDLGSLEPETETEADQVPR